MKLKINYLNTINYSLIVKGLENVSLKYGEAVKASYPNIPNLYKTLASPEQLTTLANAKRKINKSDIDLLLPILGLAEEQANANYLIDSYQTKQYIRITTIDELTRFLRTKKGYQRLINSINNGDTGYDFKSYIQKSKSKQIKYIRNVKLIAVILNEYLNKHSYETFIPSTWDTTSVSEVIRLTINEAFNYLPVTDIYCIKTIASNYSNPKANNLKTEINGEKNKEDKLLSSLSATYEQFTSPNKL